MSAPTVLVDDVLIVREGSRRLRWAGTGNKWKLVGIWPDPDHDDVTSAHLVAGGPLLVVLDSEPACVPVLRGELALPDPLLRQLGLLPAAPTSGPLTTEPTRDVDDEILDAQVPFLDWLPAKLREIGQQFACHSADVIRQTPAALLPALLLDELDARASHVRFARLTGQDGLSPHQLRCVAQHSFADRAMVAVPC